jgi:hypothetical protein
MSTAASSSSATPTVVRSHSTSSRPQAHRPPSSDLPHRTRSTTTRPPSSYSQHHSSSRSQSYDRRPPSNHAALANVARRDFEASNVASTPSSRRESSRDRSQERPATSYRPESVRLQHHRVPSKHQRDNSAMAPAAVASASDAAAAPAPPVPGSQQQNSTQPRRRTMIATPTGQWSLGKTIGAGSMGKVKIAKNLETGEQVGFLSVHSPIWSV